MNTFEQRKAEALAAQHDYFRAPIFCRVCKGPISYALWKRAHYRAEVFCGTYCKIAWLSRLNADRVRV